MTPGRLVSLDALSGVTVAAKIRIERCPRVGSVAHGAGWPLDSPAPWFKSTDRH